MTPPPASLTHVQADPAPPRPHMHQPPRHLQQAAREAARPHRDDTPGPGQPAPPDQANPPIRLSRIHRILIGVIAAGAVIIAGIGFAGSYTAVRNLALRQGFGTFSYVFPIGIDAGICVLLALDLLLTFLRIPLPLPRHTAWLLTAATIAFNAAAAWPDPLGVGMHAVIPILFVVSVEAARHAIGRTADLTADQHREGIRPARWLLSPVPTFMLWRRMTLWELRSYQQALQTEQERLIYQARLRTRYGRTWRHTAPVEALIPLKLARHGLPLTHTTPPGPATGTRPAAPTAGNTAPTAGNSVFEPVIQAVPQPTTQHAPIPGPPPDSTRTPHTTTPAPAPAPAPAGAEEKPPGRPANAATHTQGPGTGTAGDPPGRQDAVPQTSPRPHARPPHQSPRTGSPDPAPGLPQPSTETRTSHQHPTPRQSRAARQPPATQPALTTPDRYYLAWTAYHAEHHNEPTAEQLSAHLARQGLHGRGGKPVSPATLRRYLLPFRLYHLWARQRQHHETPSPETIAQECVAHGITAQYSKRITPAHITQLAADFERRWHTLNHPPPQVRPRSQPRA